MRRFNSHGRAINLTCSLVGTAIRVLCAGEDSVKRALQIQFPMLDTMRTAVYLKAASPYNLLAASGIKSLVQRGPSEELPCVVLLLPVFLQPFFS